MYLTDVSIRRPALSWVLSLILVVFGTFVFSKLPVRELPSGLQPPVVQVQVKYACLLYTSPSPRDTSSSTIGADAEAYST